MAGHSINVERMAQVIDELQRVTEALAEAFADADDAVDRLHSGWSGQAAAAHLTAHDRWAADSRVMADALARMRTTLDGARGNYQAAIEANTAMWS